MNNTVFEEIMKIIENIPISEWESLTASAVRRNPLSGFPINLGDAVVSGSTRLYEGGRLYINNVNQTLTFWQERRIKKLYSKIEGLLALSTLHQEHYNETIV